MSIETLPSETLQLARAGYTAQRAAEMLAELSSKDILHLGYSDRLKMLLLNIKPCMQRRHIDGV